MHMGATMKLQDTKNPLELAKAACTVKESKSDGMGVMVRLEWNDEGSMAKSKNKIHRDRA